MEDTVLNLFESARCVSVPLLVIRTADQVATLNAIREVSASFPLVQWDAARGVTEANKLGKEAMAKSGVTSSDTINFVEAMIAVDGLPKGTIVFVHNAHRQLQSSEPMTTAANVQAVSNLRDRFKLNFRTLVLLAPEFAAPAELEHDVVVIDHSLPGPDELRAIVTDLHSSVKGLAQPSADVMAKAVDAVSGLSSFSAEQVTAMSMTERGLDLHALWERKRVAIEQVRGLSVYRGKETFDDLRGLESAKTKLRARITAKTPIGVVVWIDSNRVALAG